MPADYARCPARGRPARRRRRGCSALLRDHGVRADGAGGRASRGPRCCRCGRMPAGLRLLGADRPRAPSAAMTGCSRAVLRLLEEDGFEVRRRAGGAGRPAAEPGLLTGAGAGCAGARRHPPRHRGGRALGAVDVGQGCVVQQGLVLGVEAIEGTDALLARCAGLRREGPGGVLVKLVKPGQDRRADLPTIGPDTVRGAAAAGLAGIAIEARRHHRCVDRAATVAAAEAAGLFLLAFEPETAIQTEDGDDAMSGKFLHTMIRVGNLDRSVKFYTELLGMKELRRRDVPDGKYTLAFLGYGEGNAEGQGEIELTYNYGVEKYEQGTAFGHLAVGVPDVAATCEAVRSAAAAR